MKVSKKIRIAGIILLILGITFIILGAVVFKDLDWPLGWKPNFGFFVPGIFLTVISIFMIIASFVTEAAKGASKGLSNLVQDISARIGEVKQAAKYKTCPYCGYRNPIENGRCDSCGGAMN